MLTDLWIASNRLETLWLDIGHVTVSHLISENGLLNHFNILNIIMSPTL